MLSVVGFINIGESGRFPTGDPEEYVYHGVNNSIADKFISWEDADIFFHFYVNGNYDAPSAEVMAPIIEKSDIDKLQLLIDLELKGSLI